MRGQVDGERQVGAVVNVCIAAAVQPAAPGGWQLGLTGTAGVDRGVFDPAGRNAVQLAQGSQVAALIARRHCNHAAVGPQPQRQLLPGGAVQAGAARGAGTSYFSHRCKLIDLKVSEG